MSPIRVTRSPQIAAFGPALKRRGSACAQPQNAQAKRPYPCVRTGSATIAQSTTDGSLKWASERVDVRVFGIGKVPRLDLLVAVLGHPRGVLPAP